MADQKSDEEKEIERRRDEIARRMLNTPPSPRAPKKGKDPADADPLRADDYFLVVGDKLRIAHPVTRDDKAGSITVDLYRNLDDYGAGRVMEHGFRYWP